MQATTRTKRITAGICCLLAGALVAGWAIGRYLPGSPRTAATEYEAEAWSFAVYSTVEAESVVDIPPNMPYALEDLEQGRKHLITDEELDFMGTEIARQFAETPEWSYECSALTMKVESSKAVSLQSFREWYPHYAEANPRQRKPLESFVVFADITLANESDAETYMPTLALWADRFDGTDSDFIGSGWQLDLGIFSELYGEPRQDENLIHYALKDGWNILAPSEKRTITVAFVLPKQELTGTHADGTYDLSKFCITTWDSEPATAYRFWLPDPNENDRR
ncbi:hypothetical protein [Raoultibacter phocaeensis]|uniref:hypothetical protein n=1 Tax=Raoultibacter phocaeensis TaxID=2479841 RepID=UPI001119E99D|nr:hypothetical protein [Raoultibacter phocaeensis]